MPSVIATIQLPFWTLGVLFLLLCWLAIGIDAYRKRRRARAGEASRLHALNEIWTDEPRVVSPRPAATDAGTLGDAAA